MIQLLIYSCMLFNMKGIIKFHEGGCMGYHHLGNCRAYNAGKI
jgi:hypothetical protein